MTVEDRVVQALRQLLDKVDLDLMAGGRHAAEVAEVVRATGVGWPSRGDVARVAIALDHYYTSLESTFEAVVRAFDEAVPAGPEWHRALLEQVARQASARPPLLCATDRSRLAGLLKFRHFLRHAYAVDLDWEKMRSHAEALSSLHAGVARDVDAFRAFVRGCLAGA